MNVSVSEAKAQLTELVRRAQDGERVVLTRHGKAAVRLVAVAERFDAEERWAALLRARGSARKLPGVSAATSQDFLYDENGLPK